MHPNPVGYHCRQPRSRYAIRIPQARHPDGPVRRGETISAGRTAAVRTTRPVSGPAGEPENPLTRPSPGAHAGIMDDLAHAAELFVLRELGDEHLSLAAAEALARGLDSPALVELACLHRTDCAGAPELFRTALAELEVVSDWRAWEVDVRLGRARDHATALLAGEGALAYHLGATTAQLRELAGYPDPPAPELEDLAREFEELSEYQDFADPTSIREQSRQACRNLLAGPPYTVMSLPVVTSPPRQQPTRPARWRRFVDSIRSRRAVSAAASPQRPSALPTIHERCCVSR